ncbi:hypothetical protein AcW1_009684 [Taiwanofungus camphoratus]|nr:hypothetical protein AcW1_009684 [Antrodia cinnamomea]
MWLEEIFTFIILAVTTPLIHRLIAFDHSCICFTGLWSVIARPSIMHACHDSWPSATVHELVSPNRLPPSEHRRRFVSLCVV